MSRNGSIFDKLYYRAARDYTKREGNVDYLDGQPLQRPAKMPWAQRLVALVLMIAAIGISYYIVDHTVLERMRATELAQKSLEENLARPTALENLPYVPGLIVHDNASIESAVEQMGYAVYDVTSESDADTVSFYALPQDVTVREASTLFTAGINNLSAVQASRILQGSWYCNVDRADTNSVVVRYVDFSTSDLDIAIQNAFLQQGFSAESVTGDGVDTIGNTFRSGTVDVEGMECTWRISALPVDDVYSVAGLTENGVYIGIRVTQA